MKGILRHIKPLYREILITIVIAVAIFIGIQTTFKNYVIWETCMEPNFYEGQQVLVNKIVYSFKEPERGDIIILHPPAPYNSQSTPFIKRVIGLPGEIVEVKGGEVYIDGVEIYEPYIKEPPRYTLEMEIPENEYFVLGDNRNNANDSHKGWTLPRENIIGKTWLTIWPPGEWGTVANYSFGD
ncbi:signal peptidase I [Chloroflexota bacterium]